MHQSTSDVRPYLWLSHAMPHPALVAAYKEVLSHDDANKAKELGGHHIIALDPGSTEAEFRAITIPLLASGSTVEIFTMLRPIYKCSMEDLCALPIIVSDQTEEYSTWDNRQKLKRLSEKEASKIARLLLCHFPNNSDRFLELRSLGQRAGINDWAWSELLKTLEPVESESSDDKQLELKAIAQERDPYKFTDKLIRFCKRTGWTRQDAEQQIRLFKAGITAPKAKRLKGKDFLALETESISWVFPGIIPSRGVFILGGNPGAGKTTLAYDAAGSLLLGEEFLGEHPVRRGKVLIVTSDELPCFTQDKLIDRGLPLDNEDWEILLNWDTSQWTDLEDAVADIRPTLIVIDSFSSIHRDPKFDENSSQAKATIYDLEALTNAYGTACILIHHLSKSKENQGVAKLRGSSAISAAASVVCLMEGMADGTRRITFPKIRGGQTEPITANLDSSEGRYKVIASGESEDKSLANRVLEFLQKSPHKRFELEEIHEGLNIPSSQKYSVHQALGRLFKRGLITKRPSKLGGKRKVYGCSTPQEECDTSLRKVNIDIQDTHPPVSDKVSTHLSENVDSKELQRVDSVLTRVDSVLTHQNIKHPVNTRKADGESNPDVLTNKGGEGCVSSNFCPTVTLDSRSSLPKVGERWEWMSDESPRTVVLIIEHELNNDYEVRGVDEFGYLHSITRNDVRRKFWEVRK